MYSPAHFMVEDPDVLTEFMRRHSFATLVTQDDGVPHATHVPVLFHREPGPHGTLLSHLARANPQWRHFDDQREVLVIFQGPHAYVSPAWYSSDLAVPTWNYTAVHAYGRAWIVNDHERFAAMLRELVEFYEAPRADRWAGDLPENYRDKLMAAIVGIEIEITRLEGKFKLSQNRPAEDRARVAAELARSNDQTDREVAEMMRAIGAHGS